VLERGAVAGATRRRVVPAQCGYGGTRGSGVLVGSALRGTHADLRT